MKFLKGYRLSKLPWRSTFFKNQRLSVGIGVTFFLLVLLGVFLLGERYYAACNTLKRYREEWEEMEQSGFVLAKDVKAGTVLTSDMVLEKTLYAYEQGTYYTSSHPTGKVLLVDGAAGLPLMECMLQSRQWRQDTRRVHSSQIQLEENFCSGDCIDVRIRFSNGEDYTVLAYKEICSIGEYRDDVELEMNETEILRFSSAVKDVEDYEGSYLYAVVYVQPLLQQATRVDYPMRQALLLESSKKAGEKTENTKWDLAYRKALEERLQSINEEK